MYQPNKRPLGHIVHLRILYKSRIHLSKAIITYKSWNWLSSSGEDFQISWMYFCNFVIISLWKKVWPFNINKPKSSSSMVAFYQSLVEIGPIYILSMYIHFHNYLPLEKGRALHLNKFESPSLKDALWQVWLKLAQWFWRRKIFKIIQCFFAISLLSFLGKGQGPLFEETWIPFTKEYFMPSLVEIGPVILEKKKKMWKVSNDDNDNEQWTNCDQKSSLEPLAQVS